MNARMLAVAMALGLAATQASANEGRKDSQRSQAPSMGEGKAQSSGGQAGKEPMMRPGPEIKGHASDQTVTGRVAEVSGDSVKIEARGGQSKDLQLAPQTVIDGKVGDPSALKEGQQVRASFNEVDGKSVAVEIKSSKDPDAGGSSMKKQPESGSTGSQRGGSGAGSATGAQQQR